MQPPARDLHPKPPCINELVAIIANITFRYLCEVFDSLALVKKCATTIVLVTQLGSYLEVEGSYN